MLEKEAYRPAAPRMAPTAYRSVLRIHLANDPENRCGSRVVSLLERSGRAGWRVRKRNPPRRGLERDASLDDGRNDLRAPATALPAHIAHQHASRCPDARQHQLAVKRLERAQIDD